MNNVIMRTIDVTTSFSPLVAEELIGSVTLSCPPTNTGNVVFQGDDGSEVPWLPGQWHRLYSVNLAAIRIKGAVGDKLNVVGGTW
jgi:hypothetical protein